MSWTSGGEPKLVSTNGAELALWSPDGRDDCVPVSDRHVVSVPIRTDSGARTWYRDDALRAQRKALEGLRHVPGRKALPGHRPGVRGR